MDIALTDLAPLRDLYNQGRYLEMFRLAEPFGPLREWRNTPARLLGGRMALQLGAPRLGRWLHLRAFRDSPTHPEAIYYHARRQLDRFGPLACREFMAQHTDWSIASPEVRADWHGLEAVVLARLRDFDRAEKALAKAESIYGERPWLCVERAVVLECEERLADALKAAERSLELQPWFRPGVQAKANILNLLERRAEAIALLEEGLTHIQSGLLAGQLAALHVDAGDYAAAGRIYDRFAELTPLLEEEGRQWLAARRADVAYFLGNPAQARELARQADEGLSSAFAERLANALQTAAPVTPTRRLEMDLASTIPAGTTVVTGIFRAIRRYWQMPPVEINLADSLPNDGIADPRERLWAEANGFTVREFTLSIDTAATLIERGVPIVMTLVDAGYMHVHLVIAADRLRDSILFRQPGDRRLNEMTGRGLRERYSAFGPRCLVLVPRGKENLLDGIEFPEEGAYDLLHQVQVVLQRHERLSAVNLIAQLETRFPAHRQTLLARFVLARYDLHPVRMLLAAEEFLAQFPQEATFQIIKLGCLREIGRKTEREAFLKELMASGSPDPIIEQLYAQYLAEERQWDDARRLLRRTVRKRPNAAGCYYLLGSILWEMQQYSESAELHRLAACLDEREDSFAEAYLRAARVVGTTPEAMRFLSQRGRRTGTRSTPAIRTLFQALSEQQELEAAFDLLDRAVQERPHDAGLLLFAAEQRACFDASAAGRKLLEQARPHADPAEWLRVAGRIAQYEVDLPTALKHNRDLLEREPLAVDAMRTIARLLGEMEGRAAALAFLREVCDRYPHFYPVWQLRIDWLRADEPGSAEADLRHLLEICPQDAWARRELSLHLANSDRIEEALHEVEIARRHDPDSPSWFYTRAHVLFKADRITEAKQTYREILRRSVENDLAITELLNLSRGQVERNETFEFLLEELKHQRVVLDGVLTYREHAVHFLDPEELCSIFEALNDRHPDSWQTWSVLIQQYIIVGRLDEAEELARTAIQRFPLIARLWVDLGEVYDARKETEQRIEALRRAVEISPGWGMAARELAEALEENKQSKDAITVLEQAIARNPFDPMNHGYLADTLWNIGESTAAIARASRVLRLDPGADWAWRALSEWTERTDEPEKLLEIAREVTRLRPGDPRAWSALSKSLGRPEHAEEALAALDRAIALQPRNVEVYDLKAERLVELGRFEEALATLNAPIFNGDPPMVLQGRAAWVEAKRGNYAAAIPPMQALVAVEPNYYWGWQQLADWYNETGKSELYLEAAGELVRIRPDSPLSLAVRGDARLQTGDRDGAKEDLRAAQKINPGYPFAGLLLFDAYLADGELRAARDCLAILQEHIGGALVVARHVQLAAKTGEKEEALQALRELCRLPSDLPWAMQASLSAIAAAGWGAEIDEILRQAWNNEDGDEFNPHAVLAWVDSPSGAAAPIEERLQALDKLLAAQPRMVQAWDTKIELLCRTQRWNEALPLCSPTPFGDKPPLILRGRAAWIKGAQGNRKDAIAEMRAVLNEAPDFYWGWQQLANWYDAAELHTDYLEAAENMVRLQPQNPTSWGYRGEARLHTGDRRGAKADFAKAFEIDGQYTFAGLMLLEQQLDDNELVSATETLAKIRAHAAGPLITLSAMRLAVKKRDLAGAEACLVELIRTDATTSPQLHRALDLMVDAGWGDEGVATLRAHLGRKETQPLAGAVWAERCLRKNDLSILDCLPTLLEQGGPVAQQALYTLLEAVGTPDQANVVLSIMQRFGDYLRRSTEDWAHFGEALTSAHQWSAAAAWLSDWTERTEVKPWMLLPLSEALTELERDAEARQVSKAALLLPGSDDDGDPAVEDHAVRLALFAALEGDLNEAEESLHWYEPLELDDDLRFLDGLTQALLLVLRAHPGRKANAFVEAKEQLRSTIDILDGREPTKTQQRLYRRTTARLAAGTGGVRAWLWNLWQRLSAPLQKPR